MNQNYFTVSSKKKWAQAIFLSMIYYIIDVLFIIV